MVTAATCALARLLPALARARDPSVPLDRVFVPAVGSLEDSTQWMLDLYRAQLCPRPGPATCGPVAGWNVRVYGLPGRRGEGIGAVPGLRADMASGANNGFISERGVCSLDVDGVQGCDDNTSVVDGTSQQTAAWLGQSLREAAAMHRAGWLKAVLVWARASGGWAMQLDGGALTAQGRARSSASRTPRSSGCWGAAIPGGGPGGLSP